jgi:hypothetical protein
VAYTCVGGRVVEEMKVREYVGQKQNNATSCNCFKWDGEGVRNLTNVQCKAVQNCHNKSTLYN